MILNGTNTLLMGPSGTGKTWVLGTMAEAGIELFYLGLENGLESFLGYWRDRGAPIPPNVHWAQMPMREVGFTQMISNAEKINQLSMSALCKLQDPDRMKYNDYIRLLTLLNDFIDARTGKSYGSVASWGPDRCIAIDGLTGIGRCAMSLVVGGKPVRDKPDYGIAQDQIESLLYMLCDNCPCHFILDAHVDRQVDEINGGLKLMVSSVGKALAPKLPSMFSDVILTVRAGDQWSWDTSNSNADLKIRNLPVKAGIPPDFRTIIAKWRNRAADETVPDTQPNQ